MGARYICFCSNKFQQGLCLRTVTSYVGGRHQVCEWRAEKEYFSYFDFRPITACISADEITNGCEKFLFLLAATKHELFSECQRCCNRESHRTHEDEACMTCFSEGKLTIQWPSVTVPEHLLVHIQGHFWLLLGSHE